MTTGQFWHDAEIDLKDETYRRQFVFGRHRVQTIDRLINFLEDARREAGLTKADLARRAGMSDAVLRRLLTASDGNPTLNTLSLVATALGYRITLEQLSPEELGELDDVIGAAAVASAK
jgi:DNA-binding phage protein